MRDFEAICTIAADRKGGVEALEALFSKPLTPTELSVTLAERWLAAMAICLFQAGFNWKIVEAKWAELEKAFDSFDPYESRPICG
ncbi:hypothetical protein [Candidatus Halocynthiibacter alkanivorans]|uniref:hypothetical protein n=1 Tax=Candidatus Halocynthiibacter alkanivorans TaxID=2267619 RepID=UPI000DF1385A|nr:hypothetical protein [Candidatus Halocynthiibacter alkanivorans]